MNNPDSRTARQKTTKDMAFAAYILMNGLPVKKAEESRSGRANEYSFVFDDLEHQWEQLAVSFANSEALKFDNSVRSLKKLCKRNGSLSG